jgi:hypothetical protein
VRIRLVRAGTLPGGDIEVVLEVHGEPQLHGFGGAGGRADQVIDDRGQKLIGLPTAAVESKAGHGPTNGIVVVNGTPVSGPMGQDGPYQVTLRLAAGALPAKALKELSGKLSVHSVVDTGHDLVVDKILKAAGQSVKGQDGQVLHVRSVEQLANGTVRLQIALENTPNQGMGGGFNPNGGNIVVIQNGNNVVIGGGTSGPPAGGATPRLVDAQGKSYTLLQSSPSVTITNNQVFHTTTLIYRAEPGQGPPAQLVLPGQRLFTFAVPFTFKDVVLR